MSNYDIFVPAKDEATDAGQARRKRTLKSVADFMGSVQQETANFGALLRANPIIPLTPPEQVRRLLNFKLN